MSDWAVIQGVEGGWEVEWWDNEAQALEEAKKIVKRTGNSVYIAEERYFLSLPDEVRVVKKS